MNPGQIAPEPVRLVVWDLDETLWRGTITEGGVTHVAANYDAVRQLARRGIVSAICSKNDRATVEAILTGQGVWDLFVFPSIDWSAKGPRVRALVETAGLRPATVLFIDDNPSNRAEVAAAVPGIQVADEHIVPQLLQDARFTGKDDPEMTRLGHYKVLEARAAMAATAGSATDFLRSSGIEVEVEHDVEAHLDRAVELINRTNQLNFTKLRLPQDPEAARAELRAQLHATTGRRAGLVRARDRFGDHGIVGFWMMDGIWVEPYLIHFAFSCRTLGMGVEQWVYERLGRPRLAITGEVAGQLDGPAPDWINAGAAKAAVQEAAPAPPAHVRLRGGCELEVLRHFFSFGTPDLRSAFVFPRDGQTVWASHTTTLFPQPAFDTAAGRDALAGIGFRPEDFAGDFLAPTPQPCCLVLSASADAQVPLFRHRRLGFTVPVKLFGLDLTGHPTEADIARFCEANKLSGLQAARVGDWVRALGRDYEPLPFAAVDWAGLYERLAQAVPRGSLLVMVLPLTFADTPEGGVTFPEQEQLNALLHALAARHPQVRLVDTAECLRSRTELRKFSHLHFARDVYFRLYERIVATHAAWQTEAQSRPAAPPRKAWALRPRLWRAAAPR